MLKQKGILQEKLDEFIRKYYLNRMLQGVLVGTGGLLLYILLATSIEYFAYSGQVFRAVLFYTFLGFLLSVLVFFVLIPLLKSRRMSGSMSYKEASELVGSHFPEIRDSLLNTLQLQEQAGHSDNELLLAGIRQRTEKLSPFRFSAAVDLPASFKRYGRYTLLPLLLFLLILVFQSNIILKPGSRILQYNQHFVREAPFRFLLLNKTLNTERNSDLTLELEVSGQQVPTELFLKLDGHTIKMEAGEKNRFSYRLYNLTQNHTLVFTDGEFESLPYTIKVLPNPSLLGFKVKLSYPSYTGRAPEELNNTGDLTVPEGTRAEWIFTTRDAEMLEMFMDGTPVRVQKNKELFQCTERILKSTAYQILLRNTFITGKDTMRYRILSVPDRFPGIAAEQSADSSNPYRFYFYGKADDDYGISRIRFAYRKSGETVLHYLPVSSGSGSSEIFSFLLDLKSLKLEEGQELEYFFEVWDNDGVHGKKSSRSQVFSTKAPTRRDLLAEAESSSTALKNKLSQTMKEVEELRRKSRELSKELSESDALNWQEQQKLNDLISQQKKLEQKAEELKKENRSNREKQDQLSEQDKELLDKQKELDKLFNEVMSPEMKALLKKLEEALKQQNKEALREQLEQMNKSHDEMNRQLDRALEQFKQLEIEKRIGQEVTELKKLAEKQEELARKTLEKSAPKEELQKQQQDINKAFDDLKKEMQKTMEKNSQLETPMQLEDNRQEQDAIQENLEQSSAQIEKKQNKKAAEKQQQSSDQMEELAEKMEKSLEKSQEEQEEEDYDALRQILENLIELSHQQEDLMASMRELRSYSPKFVELSGRQRKLKENAAMVQDSLLALSKRQIQIRSFVNKEISNIGYQMDEAIAQFGKVRIQSGVVRQQYVMTGLNNLAVMLSESLKKMQESMNEKKQAKSSSQCKNPGKKQGKPGSSGKPKMGGMKQVQDEINKQLQQMKNGKQNGQSPGSEQFARMAARQEALRRELERLQKMLREEGKPGAYGDLEKTRQLMEQQERDLVNRQIGQETLRRMKEIESRMLEHEKAEREQGNDEQREAEQAEEITPEIPPAMKEYLEKKAREMELLRTVPNELTPYYKDRVRAYFLKLGSQ